MPSCHPVLKAIGLFVSLTGSSLASAAPGFQYWNPLDTGSIPKTLSAMGVYQDIKAARKVLIPAARAFEVNSALWSDGAKKKRWVLLKAGTSIGFREKDDYWDYPEAAVFIKNFSIDTVAGDTSTRILWETRVMLSQKTRSFEDSTRMIDTWYGYSYKWDADQKEARLVGNDGLQAEIRTWPEGRGKPSVMKKWVFPQRSQCLKCHVTREVNGLHGRSVLGFFTAQLNRAHRDSVGRNQLDVLFGLGVLKGSRPATWSDAPRWRAIEDDAAGLEVRARSYIAANCSGCHGNRGIPNGAIGGASPNYDFHTMEPAMDLRHHPVSWPFFLDADSVAPKYYVKDDYVNNPGRLDTLLINPAVIVPGYPQKSVLLFRQMVRKTIPGNFDADRNQMPPLATFEVNVPATDLIRKWILEMGPKGVLGVQGPIAAKAADASMDAFFQGRTLIVGRGGRLPAQPVSMLALNGRQIRLERMGDGLYALPAGLPKGLYYVRIGAKTLLKSLL
jgi:hypothetical protein